MSNNEHLEDVSKRIAASIIRFCNDNTTFHADDLRHAVAEEVGYVAPGSPDRVLRSLRQKGVINYRVLSRHKSLYEIVREAA
jgi:hypothetical protein